MCSTDLSVAKFTVTPKKVGEVGRDRASVAIAACPNGQFGLLLSTSHIKIIATHWNKEAMADRIHLQLLGKKKLREFKRKSLIHNTLNHPSNCPDPPSSNDHLFWSLQSSLNFTSMNGKKTICYNCLHRNDICSRVILFTNRLQNVVNQSGVWLVE